ncbi:hypothetical protein BV97_01999 [Novosphingobium resinovorum]|jgi:hypothetical protein|uniref:Uncharacterized protein n=1 Tax=Novosphingobium resinovorum TaxID=158500 RepID=A0A031K1L5_9SPHN|nr:hypothetical protein [Novosphingobium resinovorum]EZP82502.1 hypothetical protein BV97_01999 [Novosphingobium resinovorum]
MTDPSSPLGHNGGPPLDEDEGPPVPRYCKYCRHWSAPSNWEVHAYESFQLGLSRRRVKRPTGSCDRVLIRPGKPLAFSATTDTFGCFNFSAKPREPFTRGHGFVTIYAGDHVVWQGWEKDLPDEYR